MINNNDYYQELPTGNFVPQKASKSMYDSSNLTLKLTAVIRGKNNSQMALLDNGIAYSDGLTQEIIKQNENSNIVKAQKIAQLTS